MTKQPKRVIAKLKEIRRLANFENANFNTRDIEVVRKNNTAMIVYEGKEYTCTEWIKEITRLYRDSWINPLIDELLAQKSN